MLTRVTDILIEDLINVSCAGQLDPRCRHLMTHALHGLVRVAQLEQLQQLRLDVRQATGGVSALAGEVSDATLMAGCGNASTRPT